MMRADRGEKHQWPWLWKACPEEKPAEAGVRLPPQLECTREPCRTNGYEPGRRGGDGGRASACAGDEDPLGATAPVRWKKGHGPHHSGDPARASRSAIYSAAPIVERRPWSRRQTNPSDGLRRRDGPNRQNAQGQHPAAVPGMRTAEQRRATGHGLTA